MTKQTTGGPRGIRSSGPTFLFSSMCAVVAGLAVTSLTGCHDSFNPFSQDIYLEAGASEEKLQEVDRIDFDEFAVAPDDKEPRDLLADMDGQVPWGNQEDDTWVAPEEIEYTIEECRQFALQNNLDLKVSLINPTITRESITESEAAFEGLFSATARKAKTDSPTASSLSGSQTESDFFDLNYSMPLRTGGNISLNVPINKFQTDNSFSTLNPSYTSDLNVSISQPLLRNAGVRTNTYGIRIAHYQTQIAEARSKLEVIRVIAVVDRAYWRLYASRKALEVRIAEYDLAMDQLARAERMVKEGEVAEIEVIRAQSGVANRIENIIIAENSVRDIERDLKRVLSIPGIEMSTKTRIVPSTEPNPVEYELDGSALTAMALDTRMEMLELELQLASDASTIDLRRNQTLPLVNLDYTYGVNGLGSSYHDAFEMTSNNDFVDHTFGLRVEVPVGNEAAMSRLRSSLYSRIQRLASRDNRIAFITQEVLNAVDQLEANWHRVLASRQSVLLSSRTADGEERQFSLGLRTSTDVLDAQTQLADAYLAEIRALAEYEVAQVDLSVAIGMTLGASKVRWEATTPEVNTSPWRN